MLENILEYRKGYLFVRPYGMITKTTANIIEKDVIETIQKHGIHNVVWNFKHVKQIDEKGIHLLFYTYELCHQNKGEIFLCEIEEEQVRHKIKNSRLLRYVKETKNELSLLQEA